MPMKREWVKENKGNSQCGTKNQCAAGKNIHPNTNRSNITQTAIAFSFSDFVPVNADIINSVIIVCVFVIAILHPLF